MKKYTLLLLCALSVSLLQQAQAQSRTISAEGITQKQMLSPGSLEAKFTADKTNGPVPLEVHFTDQSTGTPISWQWDFGDGSGATDQHPVHTYQAKGSYTVKLTISDGTYFYSLEKQNYITVNELLINCDTLHSPLPEPLLYYFYKTPNSGYLTGNNSYGDKAVADYFDNTSTHAAITSVDIDFAKGVMGASNENIVLGFWDLNITFGRPGNLISTDTISLSNIASDVAANRITHFELTQPVYVNGPFFAGVFFPKITGDTIAVWTTEAGALGVNTGWILDKLDQWSTLVQISGFNFTTAIYPEVCNIAGIHEPGLRQTMQVWPNPCNDFVCFKIPAEEPAIFDFSLLNSSGMTVRSGRAEGNSLNRIDTQELPQGVYMLTLQKGIKVSRCRLIIAH